MPMLLKSPRSHPGDKDRGYDTGFGKVHKTTSNTPGSTKLHKCLRRVHRSVTMFDVVSNAHSAGICEPLDAARRSCFLSGVSVYCLFAVCLDSVLVERPGGEFAYLFHLEPKHGCSHNAGECDLTGGASRKGVRLKPVLTASSHRKISRKPR